VDLRPARRASARIRGIGKKYENRLPADRRDMGGAGVIADGESGRSYKIDQARKFGSTHEVDRNGAGRADFGSERFLPPAANDDW